MAQHTTLPRYIIEHGLPIIKNYTPEEYEAFDQNFQITQDSFGVLYFANGDGVLIYDGENWELIPLANNGIAYSIHCTNDQVIYVGGSREIGYIAFDSTQQRSYFSLSDSIPEGLPELGTVRNIISTGDEIYFYSSNQIFRYHQNQFSVIKANENLFNGIFQIKDQIWIPRRNKQMGILKGDIIQMIESFPPLNSQIISMSKFDGNKLILGAYQDGLYVYDQQNLIRLKTQIDGYLREHRIKEILLLSDRNLAIATRTGGIVIIDTLGNHLMSLEDKSTMISKKIFDLFIDSDHVLWAGMDYGISKIEYPSRFSIFDERNGLEGVLTNVVRHNNKIHVATEYGIYVLETSDLNNAYFRLKYPLKDYVDDMLSMDGELMLTYSSGVYTAGENGIKKIAHLQYPNSLVKSTNHSERIYVGHNVGIQILERSGTQWNQKPIEGIDGQIYGIQEMPSGDIWLETDHDAIWRVTWANSSIATKKYSVEQGLPNAVGRIFRLNDRLYFREIYGYTMYLYNPEQDRFIKDTTINQLLGIEGSIKVRFLDEAGNIWFDKFLTNTEIQSLVAWKDGKSYQIQDLEETRIQHTNGKGVFPEYQDKVVWNIGKKSLAKTNLNQPNLLSDLDLHTVIKKVTNRGKAVALTQRPTINFKRNQIRFEYACPSYFEETKNQFQVKLLGYDEKWSDWSIENTKEFTNLDEGEYTFFVRSKNILGHVSPDVSFSYRILPPWYRTWWAFILYIILLFVLIWLLLKWRSQQLEAKNLELERIIKKRTAELASKNEQLATQAHKLKEVDQMKSRLFANISHEFRTPLTLIKGPLDQIKTFPDAELNEEQVDMMHRNADRLLKLVNQLLDLSKLDAQALPIIETETNIFRILRTMASAFSSMAAQRNLDYRIQIPAINIWASIDVDKLEKIVNNLLSNAFKFTADEGQITISANHQNDELNIEISDTGIGIPAQHQHQIFNRFYQIDNSSTRQQEGSGHRSFFSP